MKRFCFALLLACSMLPAHAGQAEGTTSNPKAIVADQQRLQRELAEGAQRYSELSSRDRRQIADDQARVFELLAGKESLDELPKDARIEAFNALQSINAILAKAEEKRMVCKSERSTGSNLSRTRCRSVGQMREEREAANRTLMSQDRPINPRGSN